jgi:uncharacterized RDD family membrane protein YckC
MAKSNRKNYTNKKPMSHSEPKNASPKNAGFFLRMGAWFYDFLIILAIVIMGAGVLVSIGEALIKMGVVHYENYLDTADFLSNHPIASPLFTAYLAALWIGFFVFFWRRGQTLGMRAWSLIIVDHQGNKITTTQALIRLFTSAFGLANLTALIDPQKRGFHDIWAKTHVIEVIKRKG